MKTKNRVLITVDDIDRHGEDCECGLCNAIGKSYGCAIFNVSDELRDLTEDDVSRIAHEHDPIARLYGPSEDAAEGRAREYVAKLGLEVVE